MCTIVCAFGIKEKKGVKGRRPDTRARYALVTQIQSFFVSLAEITLHHVRFRPFLIDRLPMDLFP